VLACAYRVWWFDRQILSALGPQQPAPTSPDGSAIQEPIVEKVALGGAAPSSWNLVVLGSGMDTRPWRLELPAGTLLICTLSSCMCRQVRVEEEQDSGVDAGCAHLLLVSGRRPRSMQG
jgi:hypothetical protein